MTKLGFPDTFSHLESYLGLINWLRNYVPYYAQLEEPLKTLMLRMSPIKGRSRRNFSRGSRIDLPSEKENLKLPFSLTPPLRPALSNKPSLHPPVESACLTPKAASNSVLATSGATFFHNRRLGEHFLTALIAD